MRYTISVVLLFLLGCNTKKNLSIAELTQYSQEPSNGLYKKVAGNGFNCDVLYKPKELVVAQEMLSNPSFNQSEYDSTVFFVVRISKNNKSLEDNFAGNPQEYEAAVNFLSNAIFNDFAVRINDEQISPISAVYVPSFGLSNYTSVMLVFDMGILLRNDDFGVVYSDSKFGLPPIEVEFDIGDIKQIPHLKEI